MGEKHRDSWCKRHVALIHPFTPPRASWARQGVMLLREEGRDKDRARPRAVTSCTHVVRGQSSWITRRTVKNGGEHPITRGVRASALEAGVGLLGQGSPLPPPEK